MRTGLSFSLKRLLGLSGLKNKVSRKIGIPLTRNGRAIKLYNYLVKLFLKWLLKIIVVQLLYKI